MNKCNSSSALKPFKAKIVLKIQVFKYKDIVFFFLHSVLVKNDV